MHTVSANHQEIRTFFANNQSFVIGSHIRPDGDAIGSVIALGLSLETLGKSVQMILEDGLPASFKFLEGAQFISRKLDPNFQAIISVDCADQQRMGSLFADKSVGLNIDHHVTNEAFAKINFIDAHASATSEILTEFMPVWGLPITRPVADALIAGIINDTIGFKTPNVTAKTLRLSADLCEIGADLASIYTKSLDKHSPEAIQYWGRGISHLQIDGLLAWTYLSLEDRKLANYPGNDDADFINLLSTVEGTEISVIFIEQKDGKVKISWRAKPGWDISIIAVKFGGGGHKAASGAETSGPLSEVIKNVLFETKNLLYQEKINRKEKLHHQEVG